MGTPVAERAPQESTMKTAADKLVHPDREPLTASEERAEKAARIRAALKQFAHLRISTEEYLREKHAELAREGTLEDT
jgi:hypothetical protein